MRAFVNAPPSMSQAMHRMARALKAYAPSHVRVVDRVGEADFQVLHAIGLHDMEKAIRCDEFAVIQYCMQTANGSRSAWNDLWKRSKLVFSYYDLQVPEGVRFLRQPLGVDGSVFKPGNGRHVGVVTSGYVAGPGAEAIQEPAEAALLSNMTVLHVGPDKVVGMLKRPEKSWVARQGLSDTQLAQTYGSAKWVSGLRHVEGFELPVVEGLACGARPIVFDRPDMRYWYSGHAVFVPETSGASLTRALCGVFESEPEPVTPEERERVLMKFNWPTIVEKFWEGVLA